MAKRDSESLEEAVTNKFQFLYKTKKGRKKKVLERDEVFCKPVAGEASPYRDYQEQHEVENRGELPQANPDILDESSSLYHQDESFKNDFRIELIKKQWYKLTVQQRQILTLVGYEGKTFENAAVILGVSKGTIQKTVERLRNKFKKCLTKVHSKSSI